MEVYEFLMFTPCLRLNVHAMTENINLRSGPILVVLIHSLLWLPLKLGALFVLPCPPEHYLQRETKIEPDLRLGKHQNYKHRRVTLAP